MHVLDLLEATSEAVSGSHSAVEAAEEADGGAGGWEMGTQWIIFIAVLVGVIFLWFGVRRWIGRRRDNRRRNEQRDNDMNGVHLTLNSTS